MEDEVPSLMAHLATQLLQQMQQAPVSQVWVVYSRFDTMTHQAPIAQQLLPLPAHATTAVGGAAATVPEDLIMEPSLPRALEQLMSIWLRAWLEEAWWRNRQAELAARVLHLETARDDLTTQTTTLRRTFFKAMHERLDTMTREIGATR
jgi:F-type H+-transporting ATPase subunit gamma